MCEAIVIAAGGVESKKVKKFEANLRKLFQRVFPEKPVSWAW